MFPIQILDCDLNYGASNVGDPYKGCDTVSELLAELENAGIRGGLVRCLYSDTVGVRYGNAFASRDTAEANEQGFFTRAVWALVPPFTGETPLPKDLPQAMRENNVGAVYLNPDAHRWVPDRLTLDGTLEVLQERRIPVILSSATGVPMELTYRILADFPKLTAIVADKYSWPNARRLYPLAESYENVHLSLSYVMDAGGVEDMVSRFGAGKVLFGSAFPYRYTGSMMAVIRAAAISDEQRAQIFGGNLERLIKGANLDAE